MTIEGKVSSKLQITIPARVRDALAIKPGDALRFEIEDGSVRLRVKRPEIRQALGSVWEKHDMTPLHEETGGDSVAYVQRLRGGDEADDKR